MIDNKYFNSLSLPQKFDLLKQKGKFLGEREYDNQLFGLFLIEDTFVEFRLLLNEMRITHVSIVDDEKELDLFIDSMNKREMVKK